MKQIIQNLRNGETILEDIPAPIVKSGYVLVRTHKSLVSLGTEKMLVEFGKGNLISKARQQPEKVKQVYEKIRTEGLLPTMEAVFNKLDEPLPLGYSNAGIVVDVGEGVTEFKVGDRVASNGHHAEIVCVPKNLCALIPDNVSFEEACFTVVGAIGLQGVRLANPTLGETVVVIGLGLIGLITIDILIANGCEVVGFDFDQRKIDIAISKGAKAYNAKSIDIVKTVEGLTKGLGCDAVIITASTKSNDVISQAAQISRKRGRIILVGVVGLDIQRSDFFKKELTFQVSCSYGPGRYDDDYEKRGNDYPLAYVRWTEKRNFETILQNLSSGKIQVSNLVTERILLENYLDIYGKIGEDSIASILEYPDTNLQQKQNTRVSGNVNIPKGSKGVIGIIGAGNFTKMTVMPALRNSGAVCKYISSAGGLTARALAKKYNVAISTTNYKEILQDDEVDLVLITTRHDQHVLMTMESLICGKHVFVEKPLALNNEELLGIVEAYQRLEKQVSLTVGFNRRFSPFIQRAKKLLGENPLPFNIVATINAGSIPLDSWVHDMTIGGGRMIGEACHFIDLMSYVTGSVVKKVLMVGLGTHPSENTDNAIITLKFENGSQGVINYFSNGNRSYPKERIEIFSEGRTLIIDNFRKMSGYGFKGFSSFRGAIDKGHKKQFQLLIERVRNGGEAIIPFEELVNTTKASFAAIESMKKNNWVNIE